MPEPRSECERERAPSGSGIVAIDTFRISETGIENLTKRRLRAGIGAVGGGDITGARNLWISRSGYRLIATVHQSTRRSPEVKRLPQGRSLASEATRHRT